MSFFEHRVEADSDSSSNSSSTNTFTLKFTSSESESDRLELELSVSDDEDLQSSTSNINVVNCTPPTYLLAPSTRTSYCVENGTQLKMNCLADGEYCRTENDQARSSSPVFSLKSCKRKTVPCKISEVNNNEYFRTKNYQNRSSSPVFNFKGCKSKASSCKTLNKNDYNPIEIDLENTLLSKNSEEQNGENNSSEDSEVEWNSFKKIRTNKVVLFSSDDSTSSEEESLPNFERSGLKESNFKHRYDLRPRKIDKRVTRSQTLMMKQIIQKQKLEDLKRKRSEKFKSPISSIDILPGHLSTPWSKSLRQKLRDMTLFNVV